MPPSALPIQFSQGIVDKTLYVRRGRPIIWVTRCNIDSHEQAGLAVAGYLVRCVKRFSGGTILLASFAVTGLRLRDSLLIILFQFHEVALMK